MPLHWSFVLVNPYVVMGILLSLMSMVGMTGVFSHDRSHRLFAIIGGISYITIVSGSVVLVGESVDKWVLVGVGIIIFSLFIANIYHFIHWFTGKVPFPRKET